MLDKSPLAQTQRLQVKARNGQNANSDDEERKPQETSKQKQQNSQANGGERGSKYSDSRNTKPNKNEDYDQDIIE